MLQCSSLENCCMRGRRRRELTQGLWQSWEQIDMMRNIANNNSLHTAASSHLVIYRTCCIQRTRQQQQSGRWMKRWYAHTANVQRCCWPCKMMMIYILNNSGTFISRRINICISLMDDMWIKRVSCCYVCAIGERGGKKIEWNMHVAVVHNVLRSMWKCNVSHIHHLAKLTNRQLIIIN